MLADDAPVALRVGDDDGEERELVATRRRDEPLQGFDLDQRDVAVEDERRARVVEQRRRLLQGVAGAELRLLAHERETGRRGRLLHLGGAVAGHDDRPRRPQAGGGVENMLQ